ncbi:hypothetical protein [uncultured Erythrobacter sp.]|uniref:hypothetical protein n=1 Tax=uncultured Erythrobacter sp. TaxID=263913 RepID=UPI0026390EF2|nr:hypothetical protein [uncultured Erythrobacter sp.]
MSGAAHLAAEYAMPEGILGLKGPVEKPAPGTLPLRGDLAHMALADTHLAAHYVIPEVREIGSNGAALHLMPRDDSDVTHQLAANSRFEVLDIAGDWAWGCLGPDGPSGYLLLTELA